MGFSTLFPWKQTRRRRRKKSSEEGYGASSSEKNLAPPPSARNATPQLNATQRALPTT